MKKKKRFDFGKNTWKISSRTFVTPVTARRKKLKIRTFIRVKKNPKTSSFPAEEKEASRWYPLKKIAKQSFSDDDKLVSTPENDIFFYRVYPLSGELWGLAGEEKGALCSAERCKWRVLWNYHHWFLTIPSRGFFPFKSTYDR